MAVIGRYRCRRAAVLAFFCLHAGHKSLGAGHWASLPRARSRQADTVAEDTNEKCLAEVEKGAAERGQHSEFQS